MHRRQHSVSLFSKVNIGNLTLNNRIVMAPMTRSRAHTDNTPSELALEYYKQRASAGLIITEGTAISANGVGYARTPAIYTPTQIAAWRKITAAVHQEGGKIILQLMHVGRIAHKDNQPANASILAPSAVKANGTIYTDKSGPQTMPTPRMMSIADIKATIAEYQLATQNALDAGFDGVELHAASGYLPMQFLASNTNLRTDAYGGSIENRLRFIVEALQAMINVNGPAFIGIRIWPGAAFNDMQETNLLETYTTLLQAVNRLKIAYVHSVRSADAQLDIFQLVRQHFTGISIINQGFDYEKGQLAITSKLADLVAYGALFIANPDLVERFYQRQPLAVADPTTFYTPGPKGYIDYLPLA